VAWNVLHAWGVDQPVSLVIGNGYDLLLARGLAARQALQALGGSKTSCVIVTFYPLEAVLSRALAHHAATSSHGCVYIG